jgi:hypothetical protein
VKNNSPRNRERHKWICAITNNENQGIGEYLLNLLNCFMFFVAKRHAKTPCTHHCNVAPKNTVHFERYVSAIFDEY